MAVFLGQIKYVFKFVKKSRKPTKKHSKSTRLSDFPILILCVRKFSENVTKAFFNKQYATMNEFCEFKSSKYQEINQACRF